MSKSYTFTLNNYTDDEVDGFSKFEHEKLTHLYVAKEVAPSTGTPHLQGYVCFSKSYRIKGLHKLSFIFKRCHLIKSDGSPLHNKNYCFKGEQSKEEWETFKEKGPTWAKNVQVVANVGNSTQGGRTDLKEFKDAILSGATVRELNKEFYPCMQKYRNYFQDLRKLYLKDREYPPGQPSRQRNVEVEIHWGRPGAGKSHLAHVQGAIKLSLASKGWFDGYDDEETVVLEEFDWAKFDIDFFKDLIDVNPVLLNVKGTSAYANWTKVILTANNDPKGWWPNASAIDREAFLDRVTDTFYYPEKSKFSKRKATREWEIDSEGNMKRLA